MPGGIIPGGGIIPRGGIDPGGGAIPAPIGAPVGMPAGFGMKLVVPGPAPVAPPGVNPPEVFGGFGGENASRGSIGPCPGGGCGVMARDYTCNPHRGQMRRD